MPDSLTLFYFPEVEGELGTPLRSADTGELVSNFFRSYYVWAKDPMDAVGIVSEDIVREGAQMRGYESPSARSEADFPPDLLLRAGMARSRGVYWRSGRVFYPRES